VPCLSTTLTETRRWFASFVPRPCASARHHVFLKDLRRGSFPSQASSQTGGLRPTSEDRRPGHSQSRPPAEELDDVSWTCSRRTASFPSARQGPSCRCPPMHRPTCVIHPATDVSTSRDLDKHPLISPVYTCPPMIVLSTLTHLKLRSCSYPSMVH
jgi:hypothetical protein